MGDCYLNGQKVDCSALSGEGEALIKKHATTLKKEMEVTVIVAHAVLTAIALFMALRRMTKDNTTRTVLRVIIALFGPILGPVVVIVEALSSGK